MRGYTRVSAHHSATTITGLRAVLVTVGATGLTVITGASMLSSATGLSGTTWNRAITRAIVARCRDRYVTHILRDRSSLTYRKIPAIRPYQKYWYGRFCWQIPEDSGNPYDRHNLTVTIPTTGTTGPGLATPAAITRGKSRGENGPRIITRRRNPARVFAAKFLPLDRTVPTDTSQRSLPQVERASTIQPHPVGHWYGIDRLPSSVPTQRPSLCLSSDRWMS